MGCVVCMILFSVNNQKREKKKEIFFPHKSCQAQADKVEHVLGGHLEIAGDLDKLDFEAKERCVVKSKKEILAIADACLSCK